MALLLFSLTRVVFAPTHRIRYCTRPMPSQTVKHVNSLSLRLQHLHNKFALLIESMPTELSCDQNVVSFPSSILAYPHMRSTASSCPSSARTLSPSSSRTPSALFFCKRSATPASPFFCQAPGGGNRGILHTSHHARMCLRFTISITSTYVLIMYPGNISAGSAVMPSFFFCAVSNIVFAGAGGSARVLTLFTSVFKRLNT